MEQKEMMFGTRAVIEAIKAGRDIEKIFIQAGLNNDLAKELITLAKSRGVPFTFVPLPKLNSLSTKNHQGVICMLSAVQFATLENIIDKIYSEGREPFFLILDRITDVRNFGAIARTVECAGLDGIIIGESGNAPITGDAMKTSAGALSYLPVCRTSNMKKTIQYLKESGIQVIACTEKSDKTIYQLDFKSPVALIVGSEEDGISNQLLKEADHVVKIPMRGKIESLNVSVATGIAIYEVLRQKNYK
jgi:23S rRNA (guanosine2251-2'-O)-methyltransferase